MEREIPQSSVIQLVLQFLRENGLNESAACLQKESAVCLNAVPDLDSLCGAVMNGDWSSVLSSLSQHGCDLPESFWFDAWSGIVKDLARMGDVSLATAMMSKSEVLRRMCAVDPDQWMNLKKEITSININGSSSSSTEKSRSGILKERARLVTQLKQHLRQVQPGRLLALLNQAAQFQSISHLLKSGDFWDVLSSDESLIKSASHRIRLLDGDSKLAKKVDKVPSKCAWMVRFESADHGPTAADFSSDGTMAVTGDSSGLVQFWDVMSGTSIKSNDEQAIRVEGAVRDLCFNGDCQMLAVGDATGSLSVWNVKSRCKIFEWADSHSSEGVSCVYFYSESDRILSASLDGSLQIFGLVSQSLLTTLKGHSSFVNDICLFANDRYVASVSADSSLCIWDLSIQKCVSQLEFSSMLSAIVSVQCESTVSMSGKSSSKSENSVGDGLLFSGSAGLKRVMVLNDRLSDPSINDARLYFDSRSGIERTKKDDEERLPSNIIRLIVQCDSPHIFYIDFNCERRELVVCKDQSMKLTLKPPKMKSGDVGQSKQPVCYANACLSPHKRLLFTLDSTGIFRAYDTHSGKLKGAFRAHDQPRSSLSLLSSPIDSSLLTFAADNSLKLWS